MNNNKITELLDKPAELEELYHDSPAQFKILLRESLVQFPDSETLKVWNVRINYSKPKTQTDYAKLKFVILISFLSFFLVKLQVIFPASEEWYYIRFVPIIVSASLVCYFLYGAANSFMFKISIVGSLLFCVVTMLLMPDNQESASIIMSQIHMPLILGSILALSFMSEKWKSPEAKLNYIKYVGEVIIYTTLILLGGMVLTGLTFGLFHLIGISIEEWYLNYVVILGVVAAPVVATYLYDKILCRESKLSAIIANIFSPLFLITVVIYLLAMLCAQKSPFSDRDFLIIFNGLLILVLGITVFSISGKSVRTVSKVTDIINISLVSVTLIINTVALSAILFRLAEYGVTPNRVAVTGANILIFVHLIRILIQYIKQLVTNSDSKKLVWVVANYLPIYTVWALFIVILLPVIFGFK